MNTWQKNFSKNFQQKTQQKNFLKKIQQALAIFWIVVFLIVFTLTGKEAYWIVVQRGLPKGHFLPCESTSPAMKRFLGEHLAHVYYWVTWNVLVLHRSSFCCTKACGAAETQKHSLVSAEAIHKDRQGRGKKLADPALLSEWTFLFPWLPLML